MKATQHLLNDHQLIRKLMEGFSPDHPRFFQILKTLQRAVVGHAWFEDTIFMPVFTHEPLLERRFVSEMYQEHQDLEHYVKLLRNTPEQRRREMNAYFLQFRVLLDTHFQKEEDGLFPMAEQILDSEGLNRLGDEMDRRKLEIRDVLAGL